MIGLFFDDIILSISFLLKKRQFVYKNDYFNNLVKTNLNLTFLFFRCYQNKKQNLIIIEKY